MTLQTHDHRSSSPNMTVIRHIVGVSNQEQEWKPGFTVNMEEMAGTQEACGLGRDALEEIPSFFEEMLSRLPRTLFLRNAAMSAQLGRE